MATLFYFAALAALAGASVAAGYAGMSSLASTDVQRTAVEPGERTRLQLAVANAREIKAALRKPMPSLEPLGSIVNRPARAGAAKIVVTPRPKLSPEASEAFAADWSSAPRFSASSYDTYDRHKPQ